MMRRLLTGLVVAAVAAVSTGGIAAAVSAPAGTPTASPFNGVPYVGAVFARGTSKAHGCTGTVVDSANRNLVLTAAHCVTGSGTYLQFAPGYLNGKTPYGVWKVTRVWEAHVWVTKQDPQHDYAFLQMAKSTSGKNIQTVTGAAKLGLAMPSGTTVTDRAYVAGINDRPITCSNAISYTGAYPTFNCHGYLGGVSGSPFLIKVKYGIRIVGLIGGLYQGGCTEWNSFSSKFDYDIHITYHRAVNGDPSEPAPSAGASGC